MTCWLWLAAPVLAVTLLAPVTAVVLAGFVVVVQTWTAHRRGADSWAQKLMSRMKQTVPKPTVASRVGGWLKGPVGGQASVHGGFGGGLAGAGAGSGARPLTAGMYVGRMLRPVTNSNAFALARIAGAGIATGGAGAIAGAALTAKGAARTVKVANTVRRTYAATQQGARHATTGNPVLDVAVNQTARAHQWLQTKTVQRTRRGSRRSRSCGAKPPPP